MDRHRADLVTALGLTVALLVDRLKRQALYKSLIFMPMAISFVGASIIWKFVYEARDPENRRSVYSARSPSDWAGSIHRTGS